MYYFLIKTNYIVKCNLGISIAIKYQLEFSFFGAMCKENRKNYRIQPDSFLSFKRIYGEFQFLDQSIKVRRSYVQEY